jgi:RsiW-degrading membrane proteinase PrsW (M82 family)
MPGQRYGDAAKKTATGQSCTEGILYFVATAMLISVFVLLFGIFIPGTEFTLLGGGTFYISYEFYKANEYWFNTIASMLGLFISGMVIWIHKRSVEKRILKYAKGLE